MLNSCSIIFKIASLEIHFSNHVSLIILHAFGCQQHVWTESLFYLPPVLPVSQRSTDVCPAGIAAVSNKMPSLQFRWKLERYSTGFSELLADLLYEVLIFFLVESERKGIKCLKAFSLQLNIQELLDKSTSSRKMFSWIIICGRTVVRAFSRRSTTCVEIIHSELIQ